MGEPSDRSTPRRRWVLSAALAATVLIALFAWAATRMPEHGTRLDREEFWVDATQFTPFERGKLQVRRGLELRAGPDGPALDTASAPFWYQEAEGGPIACEVFTPTSLGEDVALALGWSVTTEHLGTYQEDTGEGGRQGSWMRMRRVPEDTAAGPAHDR